MLEARWGHDDEVASWVADQIPSCRGLGFGNCRALGVWRDGELTGGVVYHVWQPHAATIQLSAAGRGRWTNREIIRQIWGYPFAFCQLAWAQTDPANPARAIWRRLGAQEHVIPRMLGRHTDGVLLTLTRERWNEGRFAHVKAEPPGPA